MKGATALLTAAYLSEIQDSVAAAALFADDGAIELPWVDARGQGPVAIEAFLRGLLAKVPDFRFRTVRIWIQAPDQAFGEYDVEALVPATGKNISADVRRPPRRQERKDRALSRGLDTTAATWVFTIFRPISGRSSPVLAALALRLAIVSVSRAIDASRRPPFP